MWLSVITNNHTQTWWSSRVICVFSRLSVFLSLLFLSFSFSFLLFPLSLPSSSLSLLLFSFFSFLFSFLSPSLFVCLSLSLFLSSSVSLCLYLSLSFYLSLSPCLSILHPPPPYFSCNQYWCADCIFIIMPSSEAVLSWRLVLFLMWH